MMHWIYIFTPLNEGSRIEKPCYASGLCWRNCQKAPESHLGGWRERSCQHNPPKCQIFTYRSGFYEYANLTHLWHVTGPRPPKGLHLHLLQRFGVSCIQIIHKALRVHTPAWPPHMNKQLFICIWCSWPRPTDKKISHAWNDIQYTLLCLALHLDRKY